MISPVRIRALVRKEIRQILRDGSSLLIGLLLPAVLIFIFGYGISLDLKEVPIAIVMEASSPMARDALAGFRGTGYFSPRQADSMHEAEELMRRREVDAILRIRNDFSANLAAGSAPVQLVVHGIDSTSASLAQSYAAAALGEWASRLEDRGSVPVREHSGSVYIEQRIWFNAANSSTWYLVPGLIVIIITIVGAFLTSLVMAREWERGTLEALFASPVRPLEVLLAKIIPYFGIGMAGLGLCLLAARFLFSLPFEGSFRLLLVSSMLYLLAALGMGLLISSLTRSQFLAGQITILVSFLPAVLLSGFLFDLRNVPPAVRVIGHLLPSTYYMELLKTLLLAGDNLPLAARNCGVLALDAVLFFLGALRATRKRLG